MGRPRKVQPVVIPVAAENPIALDKEKLELIRRIDSLECEALLLKDFLKEEHQYHTLRADALAREFHRRGVDVR